MGGLAFFVWVIIVAFFFGAGWWQICLYAIYFVFVMLIESRRKY